MKFVAMLPLIFLIGGLVGAEVSTGDSPSLTDGQPLGIGESNLALDLGDQQGGVSAGGLDGSTGERHTAEDAILSLVPQDVQDYITSLDGLSFDELLALWWLNNQPPTYREPPFTKDILDQQDRMKQLLQQVGRTKKKHHQGGGDTLADKEKSIDAQVIQTDENILPGDDGSILPGDDGSVLGDGGADGGTGSGAGDLGGPGTGGRSGGSAGGIPRV